MAHVLESNVNYGFSPEYEYVTTLCLNNDVDGLDEWLKNSKKMGQELKYNEDPMNYASYKGHIDVLDWWLRASKEHNLKLKYDACAMTWASSNGRTDVLEWWYRNSNKFHESGLELKYDEGAISYAAKREHMNVLEWWFRNSSEFQEKSKESGLKFKYDVDYINTYASNDCKDWFRKNGFMLEA
jgi:hypothetical protein